MGEEGGGGGGGWRVHGEQLSGSIWSEGGKERGLRGWMSACLPCLQWGLLAMGGRTYTTNKHFLAEESGLS